MTTDQVYTSNGPLEHSLFHEKSLLDTAPALITLRDIMSVRSDFQRKVTIAAADVENGEYVTFDQNNTSYYDMAQAALSSSSIPIVFPPQHFKGHTLMDGGTVWDVNISSAIDQCQAMGSTNEEITVDILVCMKKFNHKGVSRNSVLNWVKSKELHLQYNGFNAI